MQDLDLRKKAQDLINEIINKSRHLFPGASENLIEILRETMTQTYYLGWRHAMNAQDKFNELIQNQLPKKPQ